MWQACLAKGCGKLAGTTTGRASERNCQTPSKPIREVCGKPEEAACNHVIGAVRERDTCVTSAWAGGATRVLVQVFAEGAATASTMG